MVAAVDRATATAAVAQMNTAVNSAAIRLLVLSPRSSLLISLLCSV
jgi:hypothetical protein